ncbi:MAG: cation diffusion facilitator family transporter [Methanomicrobiales archaeon]|mgnify:FL=1|jgi:cobalt-zinc-cadmium efflux system protein
MEPEESASGHGPDLPVAREDYTRALWIGVAATLFVFFIEVVGGYVSGSLSLLSDAGHMVIDASSLLLTLSAIRAARSLPTRQRSYGLHRAGIFAAFLNGLLLVGVSVWILYQAYQRILFPQAVESTLMLIVAVAGLAANVTIAAILHGSHDLNIRGAFLHVVGDALSSIAVVLAALWIMATGQVLADPILSAVIAVVILVTALGVLRESTAILFQFTPRDVNLDEVIREMLAVPGVLGVHDLHIWSLSSSIRVMDAHVYSCEQDVRANERIKHEIKQRLERFRIYHSTLEFECEECRNGGDQACMLTRGES